MSFLCFIGHRKSLSEPDVSFSQSMSLVSHYTVSLFLAINDDDDENQIFDKVNLRILLLRSRI